MIPAFLLLFVMVAMSSLFIVYEGDRAIVIRFGEVLKERSENDTKEIAQIYQPGLHFKIPLFDRVKIIDARIQTMDGKADRFFTSEQKDVIIDSYVKWRVKDFNKYYLKAGDPLRAQAILNDKVVSVLRTEIGTRELIKIVSGSKYEQEDPTLETSQKTESNIVTETVGIEGENEILSSNENGQLISSESKVDGERDKIMASVVDYLRTVAMEDIGIYVVDFRMKKINLPDEVNESIYKRMRTAREAVARDQRALGRQVEEEIRAKAELEVAKTLAEADKDARRTRGEADAKAAAIYAAAYNKDPEFYSFLRSLNAYQKSFSDKSDIMVLDPSSDFFKYMNSATGEGKK